MKLLYEIFELSYTTVQMKLLYGTSLYLLPFTAKIMHKVFVKNIIYLYIYCHKPLLFCQVCLPSSPNPLRICSTGTLFEATDLSTFQCL